MIPSSGQTPVDPSSAQEENPTLLQSLGPGLITGAADDDPSGIATYSQAGAQFGISTGWTLIFTYPLMCAIQLISAQIGRVTARGIAGNLRQYYPPWLTITMVVLLFVANIINIGADVGAMAAAIKLLVGGPLLLYVAVFAILSTLLEVYVSYERYVAALKWLTLSLLAYVGTALIVHVPWSDVLRGLMWPQIEWTNDYITVVVAIFGTTISPYLFFWQAGSEVERERKLPGRNALKKTPKLAGRELKRIRLDTYVGMLFSNLVALFIVITTAVTLHTHNITDIRTAADAAEALRPIAGRFAYLVFALGIVGTGFLSLPVLAGSAAYALSEAMRWPGGLACKPDKAKAFYGTIALATLGGACLNLTNIDPMKALFWSAVINGVIAVPIMAMLMFMATNKNIMGKFTVHGGVRALGWLATLAMAAATCAMLLTSLF